MENKHKDMLADDNCGKCLHDIYELKTLSRLSIDNLIDIFIETASDEYYNTMLVNYYQSWVSCNKIAIVHPYPPLIYCSCFIMNTMRMHDTLNTWIIINENSNTPKNCNTAKSLQSSLINVKTKEQLIELLTKTPKEPN